MRLRLFLLPLFFAAVLGVSPAMAQDAVIDGIKVEGNQRIEKETIISYMPLKIGDLYTSELSDLSLKRLFSTGFFADIVLSYEQGVLIVKVVENPIINKISYEGNAKLGEKTLQKEIVELSERGTYTRAKVRVVVQKILELYRRRGRFKARVEPLVIQLPNNRINLVFDINEGPLTAMRAIHFVGNESYSDSRLREIIATRESAWWRFLSSSDNYDPDRIIYDRELLRRFYLDRGYADFRVRSAIAELTPDQNAFLVTFTVEEGVSYTFGASSVKTNIKEEGVNEFINLVEYKSGERYSASLIDYSVDAMTKALADLGYAFAQVIPKVKRRENDRVIDIEYVVTQGARVYVKNININGNVRTQDRVIRREIRLGEGDAYNRFYMDRARRDIRGLDYFDNVTVEEIPSDEDDRVSVDINVQEKPTGSLSFSLGHSSVDNVVGGLSISERNFLGRGQVVSMQASTGRNSQNQSIRFLEPYFLNRDVAAGVSFYHTYNDYTRYSSHKVRNTGLGLDFGFPTSRDSRFTIIYRFSSSRRKIAAGRASPSLYGRNARTKSEIGYTYTVDTRDDIQDPTQGWEFLWGQDFAGLGGDSRYWRSILDVAYYHSIARDWTVRLGSGTGFIKSWGGKKVDWSDRFFKGGPSFIGFQRYGVGPRELRYGDALGAEFYSIQTVDLFLPLGIPKELGIRSTLFSNFGYLGRADEESLPELGRRVEKKIAFRATAGIGFDWESPLGKVRFDYAYTLKKQSYDKEDRFLFSIGQRF